jgi:hypothetical protein
MRRTIEFILMHHTGKTLFESPYPNCSIDCSDGNATIPCSLLEISEVHALIKLHAPTVIPDQFVLLLTNDGHVARKCEIVDRSASNIKVRLLAHVFGNAPANDAVLIG